MLPPSTLRACAGLGVGLVFLGCNEASESPALLLDCRADVPAAFLSSKVDDDDGDGRTWDEDFPAVNDEDDDIADHAWMRGPDGVFHLYFQNEGHTTGSDIEHYTSTDLQSLDYVGRALVTRLGGWDADGLWAPHVVHRDGQYAMFYTGVAGRGADAVQRIGLATSTDLTTWTRVPTNNCPGTTGDGCIYECDEVWTTWGDAPGSYNQQCRDPFVAHDAVQRRWVLFATTKSRNQFGVVSVAYSSDLIHWTGAGFIDATRRVAGASGARATGGQAENPHVTRYEGTYYLLFTDWQDPEDAASTPAPRTITQYATSSLLAADPSGSLHWTYRGAIPDPGVNAIEVQRIGPVWLMTQSISNHASGDYFYRRQLRLKCVHWGADFEFDTVNVTFGARSPSSAPHPLAVDVGVENVTHD